MAQTQAVAMIRLYIYTGDKILSLVITLWRINQRPDTTSQYSHESPLVKVLTEASLDHDPRVPEGAKLAALAIGMSPLRRDLRGRE